MKTMKMISLVLLLVRNYSIPSSPVKLTGLTYDNKTVKTTIIIYVKYIYINMYDIVAKPHCRISRK